MPSGEGGQASRRSSGRALGAAVRESGTDVGAARHDRRVADAAAAWLTDPSDARAYSQLVTAVENRRKYLLPIQSGEVDGGPDELAGGRQGVPGFEPALLREARTAAGLSRAGLAAAAQVSENEIAKWETGNRVPQVDTLARLAGALKLSPLELVRKDELTPFQQLRIGAGLSQQEAAERAGLTRGKYSSIERAERPTASAADQERLAAAFGVELADVQAAYSATFAQRRASRRPGRRPGE